MTTIEYLSMSKGQRALYKIGAFFKAIPLGIYKFFKKIPGAIMKLLKKMSIPFVVLKDAIVMGDWKVRLSFLICGFGEFTRKQKARGILTLILEVAFILYMIFLGGNCLKMLPSLGYIAHGELGLDKAPYIEHIYTHNSFTIMLYSLITIFFIVVMVIGWYCSIHDSLVLYRNELIGKYGQDSEFFKNLTGKNYHAVLLTFPMVGLVVFTIIPVILMILVGFTNYGSDREFPVRLFDWVGGYNYEKIFSSKNTNPGLMMQAFFQVTAWTLIWAFFATFTNYFLGMVVAIIINTKGIKLKKLWRTILITTIAVPQFVSLLLISRMFQKDTGFINSFLVDIGAITTKIDWMASFPLTNVMIILINMWVGIPYTMLICTGILMNVPEDLYESAKIDGASPFKMYMKITLPYMLFITGPYLISSFVGNINNFNVIYLLSGGEPKFLAPVGSALPAELQGLGQSDLLITWIYKITTTNNPKDFGLASVLGVFVFVVVAGLSLIFYGRSSSVKNEEDFQ